MLESSGVKSLFKSNWEKMVLWAILIGFFYLLKSFFLLFFETFLITYGTRTVILWLTSRCNVNYRLTTVVVFILFITILGAVSAWVAPRLIIESNRIVKNFASNGDQQTREKISGIAESIIIKIVGEEKALKIIASEEYIATVEALKTETATAVKAALPRALETLLNLVKICWGLLISLLLSILFSFILVMDWQRISAKMKELEKSRIRSFYMGATPHLIAFADILGKALTAQAIIATCNSILTAGGAWFLGVPNIAVIMVMVFLCGFIPILGMLISSIPILLFGAQAGGVALIVKLIVLIALVHAFESYVLNPKITGNVLHVHPMLVLVLLLIGERFFGIWGMIVGVPIGFYIISVLSMRDETLPAAS